MSYNGSGLYITPAGQPVATGTVIQSATFNALVTDIGNTFNNVLPRDGQASMSGQLKIMDGTNVIPGIAFNSEASSGMYRPASGVVALVASGIESLRFNSGGRVMIGTTTDDGINKLQVSGPAVVNGALNVGSTVNGNASLDLGYTGGTATAPVINLHSGATATTYDARISATGGTGVAGGGTLNLIASNVTATALNSTPIGSTSASTGAFTSLTASGTTTLNTGSGQTLIGTTFTSSGNGKLQVREATSEYILSLKNNASKEWVLGAYGGGQYVTNATDGRKHIQLLDTGETTLMGGGAEAMRIDTSGKLLVGATSTYTSYQSAQTINYAGNATTYGLVLKPFASTADTNAVTFLSSASTYASATSVGSIQHLSGNAGMNLSGTWKYQGSPIVSTSSQDAANGYPGLTSYKINQRNQANTFTSYLTNTNTASRTYTFPDKDGTVAMTADLTGGPIQVVSKTTISSGVTEVDFPTSLSLSYSRFIIEMKGVTCTSGAPTLYMQFAVSGTYQPIGHYGTFPFGSTTNGSGGSSLILAPVQGGGQINLSIDVWAGRGGVATSAVTVRGNTGQANGNWIGASGQLNFINTGGFRLYLSGGDTFTGGTIVIYQVAEA